MDKYHELTNRITKSYDGTYYVRKDEINIIILDWLIERACALALEFSVSKKSKYSTVLEVVEDFLKIEYNPVPTPEQVVSNHVKKLCKILSNDDKALREIADKCLEIMEDNNE